MTIRPGTRAIWLAAALGMLSLLGFVSEHVIWLLIAGIGLGLAGAASDYRQLKRQLAELHVKRSLPQVVGRGEPFTVRWELELPGGLLRGQFRDLVPGQADPCFVLLPVLGDANNRWSQSMTFTIPIRGQHHFGPMWFRLEGPFRLLDGQRPYAEKETIRVLPETYASPERFRKDAGAEIRLLDKLVFDRQRGEGTEFESLKEYHEGDDPRRIDWRATARMQYPIVRQFQVERHRDVMILIDCGRLMGAQTDRGSKLDRAVDAALMLGSVTLHGGDRCGYGLFDRRVRGYLAPVSGIRSLKALAECVYDADVDWGETSFIDMFATLQARQQKRSLLVILSDVLDSETSRQFRASLLRLAQRHLVLFAALRTPLLANVVSEPVNTLLEGSRKAVTFRLLHEREQALQSLRHAGIHVLDVEPHQLTVQLINEFISIRKRNLL